MREVIRSTLFRRMYKLMQKRGKNIEKLDKAIGLLVLDIQLPPSYEDHPLKGNWQGCRDCHIEPNWLLIYKKDEGSRLYLEATGTHADLFE